MNIRTPFSLPYSIAYLKSSVFSPSPKFSPPIYTASAPLSTAASRHSIEPAFTDKTGLISGFLPSGVIPGIFGMLHWRFHFCARSPSSRLTASLRRELSPETGMKMLSPTSSLISCASKIVFPSFFNWSVIEFLDIGLTSALLTSAPRTVISFSPSVMRSSTCSSTRALINILTGIFLAFPASSDAISSAS